MTSLGDIEKDGHYPMSIIGQEFNKETEQVYERQWAFMSRFM
jgi:hypothetical protein